MAKYEYKYYSVSQKWPNTNMNIIRFPKNDRIRIRILFSFPKTTKYKYEYYSANQKWLITNIIRLPNNVQILLTNANFVELLKKKASKTSSESYKVMLNSLSPLMTEANYKCNSFQSIWLIRYDSGIWGWITVLAHKIVLAAAST